MGGGGAGRHLVEVAQHQLAPALELVLGVRDHLQELLPVGGLGRLVAFALEDHRVDLGLGLGLGLWLWVWLWLGLGLGLGLGLDYAKVRSVGGFRREA